MHNQDDNQVDIQNENLIDNINKNIACNIFKEQFDLINELPEKDRANVLYLAVYNAFYVNSKNQEENQVDIQDENTYISISISISKYLSNISKSVLNLLYKTICCKNYNKKWGGKRIGAGRPKIDEPKPKNNNIPTKKEILDYVHSLCKKIDVDNFIAYYEASNWCDKSGLPINWKQKAINWANKYKEPEEEDIIERNTRIIKELEAKAIAEGRPIC